ncbi:MAG: response regulator, partial [Candidatus Wallbacteria bacterium]|nr:response regulator [Candidatus Wallbacteria bacterium]
MPIKILIADDNQETRDNLKKLFEAAEDVAVVGEVAFGDDALQKCDELSPDIVIMDINMPGKNGIEATEEITLKHPDISVIIISVQDEPEYLRKSMNAGAKDYFTKPFNPLELVSNIRKIYSREQKKSSGVREDAPVESKVKGKVVTFFSTKGGCGKTNILVNMAVALYNHFPDRKVVILDMKLQFGD